MALYSSATLNTSVPSAFEIFARRDWRIRTQLGDGSAIAPAFVVFVAFGFVVVVFVVVVFVAFGSDFTTAAVWVVVCVAFGSGFAAGASTKCTPSAGA